jgi:flagellar hook-associated protein 2
MVDIVNTLNAGSGIDIKSLAKSLADQSKVAQQTIIDSKTSTLEMKVSSVGKIISVVNTFNDALVALGDPQTFHRSPNSSDASKVKIEFSDAKLAPTFSGKVGVEQLATEASLLFPPMTSLDAPLAGADANRTLTLRAGSAADPGATIATIDLTNVKTLPALRDRINEIPGYQATIIQGGTASAPKYYLGVKGGMGESSSFFASVTTEVGGVSSPATAGGLILDGTEVTRKGTNARIYVDGVLVESSSNDFANVLPGVKITAAGVTSSDVTLSSSYNTQALSDALATVVSGFNLMLETVKTETAFNLDPKKRGGLANDPSTKALMGELRRFTTQQIAGYGESSGTLAELGVITNRDGSLKLDENVFARALKEKPELVESVLASKRQVLDTRLSIAGSTNLAPGKYIVEKTGVKAWTINGQAATLTTGKLTANAGTQAAGLELSLPPGVENAAPTGYKTTVYFGKGMVERLQDMFGQLKSSQSALQKVSTNANRELSDLTTKQADIDAKAKAVEQRYLKQFTLMNSVVSESNNTRTSLKTFIDSWTAGLKG